MNWNHRFYEGCLVLILSVLMWSCDDGKRYHVAAKQDLQQRPKTAVEDILAFQEGLNTQFKDPDESPLPDRYRIHFERLDFFVPDTTYRVWAKLKRSPEALPFEMPTTTDRLARERKFGVLSFRLHGEMVTLEVYQSPDLMQQEAYVDYLFLPFSDATNGRETYSGGRYIDLRIPAADSILIDFNKAYNPYCAYNPKYSCPIVPKVNRLDFPVYAGVKAFVVK